MAILDSIFAATAVGWVVVALAAVAFVWLFVRRSRRARRPSSDLLPTGIAVWEGLPGSGKTYKAVLEMVDVVVEQRRPVYTNIPLKRRVFDWWVRRRGGDPSLVRFLDHEHFWRFTERFIEFYNFRESCGPGVKIDQIEAAFKDAFGPDILEGKEANWIPTGSAVYIDEAHRHIWFPQSEQRHEPKGLLGWLSLHRQGLYLVRALTQDAMLVSISLRREAEEYVRVFDLRKVEGVMGLRCPIPLFVYLTIPASGLVDAAARKKEKPVRREFACPWWSGGLGWSLYSSFAAMGSLRRAMSRVDRGRVRRESPAVSAAFVGSVLRSVIIAVVLAVVLRFVLPVPEAPPPASPSAGPELPRLVGVRGSSAMLAGRLVQPGEVVNDAFFLGVRGREAAVLSRDGRVWVASPGQPWREYSADRGASGSGADPSPSSVVPSGEPGPGPTG